MNKIFMILLTSAGEFINRRRFVRGALLQRCRRERGLVR
jgi:hypothetical protein